MCSDTQKNTGTTHAENCHEKSDHEKKRTIINPLTLYSYTTRKLRMETKLATYRSEYSPPTRRAISDAMRRNIFSQLPGVHTFLAGEESTESLRQAFPQAFTDMNLFKHLSVDPFGNVVLRGALPYGFSPLRWELDHIVSSSQGGKCSHWNFIPLQIDVNQQAKRVQCLGACLHSSYATPGSYWWCETNPSQPVSSSVSEPILTFYTDCVYALQLTRRQKDMLYRACRDYPPTTKTYGFSLPLFLAFAFFVRQQLRNLPDLERHMGEFIITMFFYTGTRESTTASSSLSQTQKGVGKHPWFRWQHTMATTSPVTLRRLHEEIRQTAKSYPYSDSSVSSANVAAVSPVYAFCAELITHIFEKSGCMPQHGPERHLATNMNSRALPTSCTQATTHGGGVGERRRFSDPFSLKQNNPPNTSKITCQRCRMSTSLFSSPQHVTGESIFLCILPPSTRTQKSEDLATWEWGSPWFALCGWDMKGPWVHVHPTSPHPHQYAYSSYGDVSQVHEEKVLKCPWRDVAAVAPTKFVFASQVSTVMTSYEDVTTESKKDQYAYKMLSTSLVPLTWTSALLRWVIWCTLLGMCMYFFYRYVQ